MMRCFMRSVQQELVDFQIKNASVGFFDSAYIDGVITIFNDFIWN